MFPPDFSPDEGQRDKTYKMFSERESPRLLG